MLVARQGAVAGDTQGILRMKVSPLVRVETDVDANGGARAGAAFDLEYSSGFAGSVSGNAIKARLSRERINASGAGLFYRSAGDRHDLALFAAG